MNSENNDIEFDGELGNEQPQPSFDNTIMLVELTTNTNTTVAAISANNFNGLVTGVVALDKKLIPYFEAHRVRVALRKLPFFKPFTVINPRKKFFIVTSEQFYYLAESPRYAQANLIEDIKLIPYGNQIYSNFDALLKNAKQELIARYDDEVISIRKDKYLLNWKPGVPNDIG